MVVLIRAWTEGIVMSRLGAFYVKVLAYMTTRVDVIGARNLIPVLRSQAPPALVFAANI